MQNGLSYFCKSGPLICKMYNVYILGIFLYYNFTAIGYCKKKKTICILSFKKLKFSRMVSVILTAMCLRFKK